MGDEDEKTEVILKKPAGLAEAKDGEEIPVAVGLGEIMTTHTTRVQWTAAKNGKSRSKRRNVRVDMRRTGWEESAAQGRVGHPEGGSQHWCGMLTRCWSL